MIFDLNEIIIWTSVIMDISKFIMNFDLKICSVLKYLILSLVLYIYRLFLTFLSYFFIFCYFIYFIFSKLIEEDERKILTRYGKKSGNDMWLVYIPSSGVILPFSFVHSTVFHWCIYSLKSSLSMIIIHLFYFSKLLK